MKEELKKYQKTAWTMLDHDLKTGKTDCSYLFTGPSGSHKKEAAVLFAQSLVCPKKEDGWACERCDVCRRVADGQYSDIRILDGSSGSIKKEEIEKLQSYYSRTALEEYGRKAYVINAVDKMTGASMNSILKFLEEPGQQITAILITDQPERLLTTVRSRCKTIPFQSPGRKERLDQAAEAGIPLLDAHILVEHTDTFEQLKEAAESDSFQTARTYWMNYIRKASRGKMAAAVFYLEECADAEREIEKKRKNEKGRLKTTLEWFLKTGLVYCQDLLARRRGITEDWDKLLDAFDGIGIPMQSFMMILLDSKDSLLTNAMAALVIDRLGYRLSEEANRWKDRK